MRETPVTATPEPKGKSRPVQTPPLASPKVIQRMVGVVVSDKMNKTRTIAVKRIQRHGLYQKSSVYDSRFFIHDEKNTSAVGDTVLAVMTRPLSRHKHFRLFKILQKKEAK